MVMLVVVCGIASFLLFHELQCAKRDSGEMTLRDKLTAIARWLSREARLRKNRRRSLGWIDFTERDGAICEEPWTADGASSPARKSQRFCLASAYPRRSYLLLTFPALDDEKFTVIVKFPWKRRHKSRKEVRQMLRRAYLSSTVMCIDSATPEWEIVEQLSIFLAQRAFSDSSTQSLLGLNSNDPVRSGVASRLVESFIDPDDARSYRAFKKTLRLRVVGPQEAASGSALNEEGNTARKATVAKSYSVKQAAMILGISARTLHHWIRRRRVACEQDRLGRRRISLEGLEGLRELLSNPAAAREVKTCLVQVIVRRRGIQETSARRRVNRMLKQGKTLQDIARVEGLGNSEHAKKTASIIRIF